MSITGGKIVGKFSKAFKILQSPPIKRWRIDMIKKRLRIVLHYLSSIFPQIKTLINVAILNVLINVCKVSLNYQPTTS